MVENNCNMNLNLQEILPRIRNRAVLREFCFSLGFWLPDYSCYSHQFVLGWGKGEKNVSKFF